MMDRWTWGRWSLPIVVWALAGCVPGTAPDGDDMGAATPMLTPAMLASMR